MKRGRIGLVQRLMRMAEHERFETPKGWSVLSRYPPGNLQVSQPAPEVPQRREQALLRQLYMALYKQYPEVRDQPYLLKGTAPPLAARFVHRQIEVLGQLSSSSGAGAGAAAAAAASAPAAASAGPSSSGRVASYPQQWVQQAFKQVEAEMQADLRAAGQSKSGASYIDHLQDEEGEALAAALKSLREQQEQQERLLRQQLHGT